MMYNKRRQTENLSLLQNYRGLRNIKFVSKNSLQFKLKNIENNEDHLPNLKSIPKKAKMKIFDITPIKKNNLITIDNSKLSNGNKSFENLYLVQNSNHLRYYNGNPDIIPENAIISSIKNHTPAKLKSFHQEDYASHFEDNDHLKMNMVLSSKANDKPISNLLMHTNNKNTESFQENKIRRKFHNQKPRIIIPFPEEDLLENPKERTNINAHFANNESINIFPNSVKGNITKGGLNFSTIFDKKKNIRQVLIKPNEGLNLNYNKTPIKVSESFKKEKEIQDSPTFNVKNQEKLIEETDLDKDEFENDDYSNDIKKNKFLLPGRRRLSESNTSLNSIKSNSNNDSLRGISLLKPSLISSSFNEAKQRVNGQSSTSLKDEYERPIYLKEKIKYNFDNNEDYDQNIPENTCIDIQAKTSEEVDSSKEAMLLASNANFILSNHREKLKNNVINKVEPNYLISKNSYNSLSDYGIIIKVWKSCKSIWKKGKTKS